MAAERPQWCFHRAGEPDCSNAAVRGSPARGRAVYRSPPPDGPVPGGVTPGPYSRSREQKRDGDLHSAITGVLGAAYTPELLEMFRDRSQLSGYLWLSLRDTEDAAIRSGLFRAAVRVVAEVRQRHRPIFNLYFDDLALRDAVIEETAELREAPSLGELTGLLRSRAKASADWLVATPIANLALEEVSVALTTDALLCRAQPEPGWGRWDWDRAAQDAVREHFKEQLHPGGFAALTILPRWRDVIDPETGERSREDSRVTAFLVTREQGTRHVAHTRARSRTRYAIAMWTALASPGPTELPPSLGLVVPSPRRRYGQDDLALTEQKGSKLRPAIQHMRDYRAPSLEVLRRPFEAMRPARDGKRCAAALLSASWLLYQANESRLRMAELGDAAMLLQASIDALCEPEPPVTDDERWKRWQRASNSLNVWNEIGRDWLYSGKELETIKRRLRRVRHIATHGSDSFLLNMGYPEGWKRTMAKGEPIPGEDISPSPLRSDLPVLNRAVRIAIRKLVHDAVDNRWEDERFEAWFSHDSS
jgi:hypothetical protein